RCKNYFKICTINGLSQFINVHPVELLKFMLQKMSDFKINNTLIGDNQPTYIIAELSANHEGSYEIAVKSIEAIAKTGVNAVKIQSYTPDSITLDSDLKWFRTRED